MFLQKITAVFGMTNHICRKTFCYLSIRSLTLQISALLVLIITMIASLSLSVQSTAAQDRLPDIPYALLDAETGNILSANRLDERWHPASLTKLMTAYVVFRAIRANEIDDGSPVIFTANAAKTPPGKMGYREGTRLRYDMALYTLIVKSANDVAVAVAESLAGSVPAFVDRMNAEAERLGMADTRFENPHGLHDAGQFVSARDLLILANAIWNEFPQYRALFETPTIRAGDKRYTSYNFLLERFQGTTGMKTGFVCAAGYNLVASAERDTRRLIAVVLGAASQTQRAEIAARLLLNGYDTRSGQPLQTIARPSRPTGPTNMRPVLCTQQARESRYDPSSENAVLDSPWLNKREITRQPVEILLGGIDAEPSPAWLARAFIPKRIPLPVKRPDYVVVNVDGDAIGSSAVRGTIPVPSPNPLRESLSQ